jgi:hypothetical protein
VGLYLEFLTCLGVFEAVRNDEHKTKAPGTSAKGLFSVALPSRAKPGPAQPLLAQPRLPCSAFQASVHFDCAFDFVNCGNQSRPA